MHNTLSCHINYSVSRLLNPIIFTAVDNTSIFDLIVFSFKSERILPIRKGRIFHRNGNSWKVTCFIALSKLPFPFSISIHIRHGDACSFLALSALQRLSILT